ncbi:MAG: PilZ domain-containing protein [Polyangia bacterium]
MDWVRRAGDYRVLVGKRDRLGYPLGAIEQARLDELERFFTQDANRRRAPWASREQIRAPISVIVEFGDFVGQARDISADGMYIVTNAPLPIGARMVVRVTDDEPSVDHPDEDVVEKPREQWQFGAEVVRLDAHGIGLRFVGIPLALRITHRAREGEPLPHIDTAVDHPLPQPHAA